MKSRLTDKADKGALLPSDLKQKKYKALYGGLVFYMLLYVAVTLIPVIWMMLFGFKEPVEILSQNPTFFPKKIDLGKLSKVWSQYTIYKYYLNTFIMAFGCVFFDVIINGLAGYVLSRLKPRGSKFYSIMVFTLMLLPATLSMVPNYKLYMDLHLLNSFWPIWLMAGVNTFNILLFKSSFDSISNSLIEAAKIDGANSFRIFLSVVIPLSIPVITTVSIFTFNGQFGNFFWPMLVITDPKKTVFAVRLYQLNGTAPMDEKMLLVVFSILPQLAIFAAFQKYIMGGVNVGGVKG